MSNSLKRVAERGDANDRDAKRTKESKTITELLDLSQLTTPADIHARFHELAEYLLIRSRLHLKSGSQVTTYQLLEVEFYLNNHEAHCDPFCHSVPEQRYSGNWYVLGFYATLSISVLVGISTKHRGVNQST
jgi:hypothetical protein